MEVMGENFKLARKRQKLTTIQVAERASIDRSTLAKVEKGDPSVPRSGSSASYECNAEKVRGLRILMLMYKLTFQLSKAKQARAEAISIAHKVGALDQIRKIKLNRIT